MLAGKSGEYFMEIGQKHGIKNPQNGVPYPNRAE